ncbi:NADPH-dependent F420 reductase [Streptomyces sp. NBC_01304]|uniref:NADPH-dependent F420 reductase n=1 Tax=Streptomyces sp. NBC_01304 TaxID=2903818 RepID=UPI002E12F7AE|nr:NAD(P)-binding domain-containing protein [Streptomyces sp. NBC_01304]
MKIGIIGTGGMASAFAAQWLAAGHEVRIGGRDLAAAKTLVAGLDADHGGTAAHGGIPDAVEFGEAVLLAVPHDAAPAILAALPEPALRGRTLIDPTNPVVEGFTLATAGGPSAAQRIAAAAPTAHVVKAFNLCHEGVWRLTPPVFDGRPLGVPLAGDDEAALIRVRELVRDLGCEPYAAGGLERAGLLEATAAVLIGLWVGEGVDAQAIAPPLTHAAG